MTIFQDAILEYVAVHPGSAQIDRSAGIIRDVKILGLESRNRRHYPESTLRAAIPLYENAKVNVNHPENHPSEQRKYQDRFGMIRNVRLKEGEGLFGDFYFNPKHPLAEQLLWDAENSPENVGFSHNVEAVVGTENGRAVVEKIETVRSVDLVADPATTVGLFEQTEFESTRIREETPDSQVDIALDSESDDAQDLSDTNNCDLQATSAPLTEALRPFQNRISLFERLLEAVVSAPIPSAARKFCWNREFLSLALESESPEKLEKMIAERLHFARQISGALTEAIAAGPVLAAEKGILPQTNAPISTEEFLRQIKE